MRSTNRPNQFFQAFVLGWLFATALLDRPQRDVLDHRTVALLPARSIGPSIKSPLRTSRISPVRVHSAGSSSRRTPVAGCTPLAISSPLLSAAINSVKAATAAFHACCIGSEMGAGSNASEVAPRGKALRRIQGPLEVAERLGAAALGEEPLRMYGRR